MRKTLLLSVVLVISAAGIVYAAELLNNGDFSAGTSGWTPEPLTTLVIGSSSTTGCGVDVAEIRNDSDDARIEQCIHITSPGTDWTLSTDSGLVYSPDLRQTYVVADFYSGPACDGTLLHSEMILEDLPHVPTPVALTTYTQTFTYDTTAGGANSVRGSAQISGTSSFCWGCFDNLSLSAPGATMIGVKDVTANRPLDLLFIFALGALSLAGAGVILRRLHTR